MKFIIKIFIILSSIGYNAQMNIINGVIVKDNSIIFNFTNENESKVNKKRKAIKKDNRSLKYIKIGSNIYYLDNSIDTNIVKAELNKHFELPDSYPLLTPNLSIVILVNERGIIDYAGLVHDWINLDVLKNDKHVIALANATKKMINKRINVPNDVTEKYPPEQLHLV